MREEREAVFVSKDQIHVRIVCGLIDVCPNPYLTKNDGELNFGTHISNLQDVFFFKKSYPEGL